MFALPTTTTSYTRPVYALERGGVRLGRLRCPDLRTLERLHGARAVDVDDGVELGGESRLEVVRVPLRLRPVDDADGPLQHRLAQLAQGLTGLAQGQEEARQRHFVEKLLDAS